MKLRNQVLLISLLTLLVPWAGYLFIQELELALRKNQLDNLGQHAELIANQLEKSNINLAPHISSGYEPVYAFTLPSPVILDGYFDDWQAISQQPLSINSSNPELPIRYLAGIHSDRLFLFIAVDTKSTSYRDPSKRTLTNSDHLLLKLATSDGAVIDTFASPIAPGPLAFLSSSRSRKMIKDSSLKGYWQDTNNGYQIELEIPLSKIKGGLGFAVVKPVTKRTGSTHPQNSGSPIWSGITSLEEYRVLPSVIYRQDNLESLLEPYQREYTRISLINNEKWIVAQVGETSVEKYSAPWQQGEYHSLAREILLSLFKAVIGRQQPSDIEELAIAGQRDNTAIRRAISNRPTINWFQNPISNQAIIAAAYPISSTSHIYNSRYTLDSDPPQIILPDSTQSSVQGLVLVEQTTDAIVSLSDSAMVKLITISFSVVLLIVVVLLGFASILSWRVTRLRNQIDQSINEEGRMGKSFSPSKSSDELGDLSRSFAAMHKEVDNYTEYLEDFSNKLSHELKTPLAIVRSSIENLALEDDTEKVSTYLQRADKGTQRLSQILQSMSEASRLEKSIGNTDKELFDLTEVVLSAGKAFQHLINEHQLTLHINASKRTIWGSPELIAQMMDKLVDNAQDFTPKNGNISITLKSKGNNYSLEVINDGPLLPDQMHHEIFNSFVSLRKENKKEGHMGQGLVIVKLITDFHNGRVSAFNNPNNKGVIFEILIPKG